jgi:hypothetical protein
LRTGSFRITAALSVAILLVACLVAYFYSLRSEPSDATQQLADSAPSLVDTSLLQTAVSIAPLAATTDEQANAREAWRLADHEVDLAFAWTLRQAGAEAESATSHDSKFRQLSDRIAQLKVRVEADKKRVENGGSDSGSRPDLAQAQLALDQDELDDVQQDLERQGGDKRARLQRLLQQHEASDKISDQTVKFGSPMPTGTMSDQTSAWFSLRDYTRRLHDAALQAAARASMLLNLHRRLEQKLSTEPDSPASLEGMRQLSGQHKSLAGLDQRIVDTKQLVTVYQRWSVLVEHRRRAVVRLLLQSLATILAIILVTLFLNRGAGRLFHKTDRRRLHQLRIIARFALQAVALIMILIVLFGPPTQLSTMIGLITAAVTVVMKDFIVAFLGWFTLMGKDGISVGDSVEIEGVSGEVIEIGLLKTVLFELGNWTASGLPTGRRVAFSNSFAMEGHYFNFSTSGQWLWDEIHLALPREVDPWQTSQHIREIVEKETEPYTTEAAREWQSVVRHYGTREFSAAPAVNLRPASGGLEVVVRYITRAAERNALQATLLRAIVDLLRSSEAAASKERANV